jgi:hypothetical protein
MAKSKPKGGGNAQPIHQSVANSAKAAGTAKKAAETGSPEMIRIDEVASDQGLEYDPANPSIETPVNVLPNCLIDA